MDPDIFLPVVLPAVALLATNAFYVIGEYATLNLQRGHMEGGSRDAERRASRLLLHAPPEEVLLLAQIGRSLSAIGLGYALARVAAEAARHPVHLPTVVVASLVVAAVLHAVLASQVPKLVGLHKAGGALADVVIGALRTQTLLLRLPLFPLALVVRRLARWCGIANPLLHPLVHTPDEIRILVSQGHEQGVVEEDEREMIHAALEFSDTVAREVMTPRIDIIAVPVEVTLDEALEVVVREGHSRLPVYEGSIDSVVGILLAKDLLPLLAAPERRPESFDVRAVMREPYFVPDTKPVDDILAELRQQSVHLAIVLDEFGGTYGLLTMEDLLEEIVGEINDEYDVAEEEFAATPEGDVLIDGGAALSEVNERFELALPEEDFDTLGGYIFGMLGRVPVPGDVVGPLGNGRPVVLHVEEIEDRRITRVRLTRPRVVEELAGEG